MQELSQEEILMSEERRCFRTKEYAEKCGICRRCPDKDRCSKKHDDEGEKNGKTKEK